MKESLEIHVVTPSYNQGHFIRQTITSVISQSETAVHQIVMDGGSGDTTTSVLKTFGNKISWVSEKDKGQSDALNKGVQQLLKKIPVSAHHKTIFAYLNSDDYYLPNAFEKIEAVFNDAEVMWAVGDCQIVNENQQKIQESIRWYKKIWRALLSWPVLLILNPIPQPAVFIRLSAVAKTGLFNESLNYTMDYEYWLRLWHNYGKPKVVSHILAAFRIHKAAKGTEGFEKQFAEQFQVARVFTSNAVWLLLQRLHNKLIVVCYNVIK